MTQIPHYISGRTKLVLVAVALSLSMPVVSIPWVDSAYRAHVQRRALAPFPELSNINAWSEYQESLVLYLKDHIALSIDAATLLKKLQFDLFGRSTNDQIRISQSGTPFLIRESNPSKDKWGAFSLLCETLTNEDRMQSVIQRMELLKGASETSGVLIKYVLAPTKSTLYFDELRPYMPRHYFNDCDLTNRATSFSARLESSSGTGFKVSYPIALFTEKRDDPKFYPKTNYHWNGESIDVAIRSLFDLEDHQAPLKTINAKSDISNVIGFEWVSQLFAAPRPNRFQLYRFGTTRGSELKHEFFDLVSNVVGKNWVGSLSLSPAKQEQPYTLVIGDSFANNGFLSVGHYRDNVLHVSTNGLKKKHVKNVLQVLFEHFEIAEVVFIYRDIIIDLRHTPNMAAEQAIINVLANPGRLPVSYND